MRDILEMETGQFVAILAAVVIFALAVITMLGWALQNVQCASRARGLGLEHSWGPFQGCLVTRLDGIVVPVENYGRSDRE